MQVVFNIEKLLLATPARFDLGPENEEENYAHIKYDKPHILCYAQLHHNIRGDSYNL